MATSKSTWCCTLEGAAIVALLPNFKSECSHLQHLVGILLVVVQGLCQGGRAPEQLQGLQLCTPLQGLICGPLPPVGSLPRNITYVVTISVIQQPV